MLDGLMKSGFYAKCKSLIKITKKRVDVIRRKRNATLNFLKRDVADLLVSRHDTNAFDRADALLLELDVSWCYDFVETSCEFVKLHLSVMDKWRECPTDCRETVSSLMTAAARFSDLPELRELRKIFQERYGNSVDYYASKEFVEKLDSKSYTVERKIKLLIDIASEFLISWDSRAFERKMSMLSAKPKTYGTMKPADDKYKLGNGINYDVTGNKCNGQVRIRLETSTYKNQPSGGNGRTSPKGKEINLESRKKIIGDDYKTCSSKKESSSKKCGTEIPFRGRNDGTLDKQQVLSGNEDTSVKADRSEYSSGGKINDSYDVGHKLYNKRANVVPANGIQDAQDNAPGYSELKSRNGHKETASYGNNYDAQSATANSMRKLKEEEVNLLKPYHNSHHLPPYQKPNIKVKDHRYRVNAGSVPVGLYGNGVSKGISSADSSTANIRLGEDQSEDPNHESPFDRSLAENDHGGEKDHHYRAELINEPRPKPRSHKRHAKSQLRHEGVDSYEDEVTRKPESRRSHHSKHGLQQLNDDHNEIDEEEMKLDRLLIYHCNKPSSYELGMIKRKSRTHQAHQVGIDAHELQKSREKDGSEEHLEPVPWIFRTVSLHNEETAPAEAKKVYDRDTSLQPDKLPARHVHPKLPDYDELAARFAALKGR